MSFLLTPFTVVFCTGAGCDLMRTSPLAAYYDRSFIIAHCEFCVNIYFVTQNKTKQKPSLLFHTLVLK